MVKLAIDAMGGDHAPREIIKGVQLALARFSDVEFLLFGVEKEIAPHFAGEERVKIIHCSDVIDMGEQDPIGAVRKGKDSSLVRAFRAVRDKEASGVVSAGPTQGVVAAVILSSGESGHETGRDLSDASGTGRKKAAPARCRREHGT